MTSTAEVKIRSEQVEGTLDHMPFKDWLLPIKSVAFLRKKNRDVQVGDAFGLLVQRDRIAPWFLEQMEGPCLDTMGLALEIFDRHGRLQGEYMHHPVRRGLGIWQNELSRGNFLVIETVTVMKKARRQGIGRQLVMDMIRKAKSLDNAVQFVFAYPTCLHQGEDLQERAGKTKQERIAIADAQAEAAIRVFRQLGFRRIGISRWFAFAMDASHPSRTTSVADDPDPLTPEPPLDSDYDSDDSQPDIPKGKYIIGGAPFGEDGNFDYSPAGLSDASRTLAEFYKEVTNRRNARSKYAQLYPIHHALQNLSDAECLALLKDRKAKNDRSQEELSEMRDNSRNNILHTAACQFKPKCVTWILDSIAVDHPSLKDARNIEGNTPLEALRSELDMKRLGESHGDRFIVRADKFDGFGDAAVSCMLALLGCPTDEKTEYWRRARFGCSCGFCIEGYLSHRMRQSLQIVAEETLDRLDESGTEDNRFWFISNEDLLQYVPENIRLGFKKRKVLRKGFREFISTIIECLQSGTCPTPQCLMSFYKKKKTWPQMHTFYFRQGGNIEAATNIILDLASERFEIDFDHNPDNEEFPALPRCRNDFEFELVRRQCTTAACDDQDPNASLNERLALQAPFIPFLMQMMENSNGF